MIAAPFPLVTSLGLAALSPPAARIVYASSTSATSHTATVPANTLTQAGQSLRITVVGEHGAGAGDTARVRFGGSTILATNGTAASMFQQYVLITHLTTTSQYASGLYVETAGGQDVDAGALALDLSTALDVVVDFSTANDANRRVRFVLIEVVGASGAGGSGVAAAAAYNVKAVKGAAQTITNDTYTAITFLAADSWDNGAWHDPASNSERFTVPTDMVGKLVKIKAQVAWDVHATGYRWAYIARYNSAGVAQETVAQSLHMAVTTAAIGTTQNLSGDTRMSAGDYLQLEVRQNRGGNLDVTATSTWVSIDGGQQ